MSALPTVSRDSLFTRLDFRAKLALMVSVTLVAFLWESAALNLLLLGSVVAACLGAGVSSRYLSRMVTVLLPFALLLLLIHGFFNVAQLQRLTGRAALTPLFTLPASWPLIGGASCSREGLRYGLALIAKTLTMTLVIPLGIFTTDANALLTGLTAAGIPYRLAFVFASTLRFFPLLLEEAQAIVEAQRLRGIAPETLPPLRRAQVYGSIAVPLILGALVRSQQLEIVLQARAFSGRADRTALHEARLKPADVAFIVISALFLVAALAAYLGWGIGKFVGP